MIGIGVGLRFCAGSLFVGRLGTDTGAVGVVGGGLGAFNGAGPTGPHRTSGLFSLLFVASSRGVERSDMRSPEISQMMYPLRLLSMAYSVLSQMARSSSYETKPESL